MRNSKLDIFMLIAIGVGAIVGTGVYNMPTEMAKEASSLATIIAWVITFFGIMSLAFVFKILADKKPEIKGGHFGYAREGFGDFAGALIAWGYYACAIFTIIANHVVVSEVLVYFFQIFNGSTNNLEIIKLLISSIAIWFAYYVMSNGTDEIGLVSIIITISKLIFLLIFVGFVFINFSKTNVTADFYGRLRYDDIGGIYEQIEGVTSINIWLIIGFETISILSGRAKSMKDVGNAVVISALFALILYMFISIGSLGIMTEQELSALSTPSTAHILSSLIGNRGEIIIHFGILISAMGTLIAWTFASVEILYQVSREGLFISYFGKETNNVPKKAMFLTSIVIQALIIITFFYPSTYRAIYLVATSSSLIPFLITTLYAVKVIIKDNNYASAFDKSKELVISISTLIFIAWLLFASKLVVLLHVMEIYAIGVVVYIISMKMARRKIFNEGSGIAALIIFICGVFAWYVLYLIW